MGTLDLVATLENCVDKAKIVQACMGHGCGVRAEDAVSDLIESLEAKILQERSWAERVVAPVAEGRQTLDDAVRDAAAERPPGRPGEKNYAERGRLIGKMVSEKQAAYGDSFGKSGAVLRILYPDGIRPNQYDDMLGVARVLDKLFRIATDRDALGESPWQDIAGYGLLGAERCSRR